MVQRVIHMKGKTGRRIRCQEKKNRSRGLESRETPKDSPISQRLRGATIDLSAADFKVEREEGRKPVPALKRGMCEDRQQGREGSGFLRKDRGTGEFDKRSNWKGGPDRPVKPGEEGGGGSFESSGNVGGGWGGGGGGVAFGRSMNSRHYGSRCHGNLARGSM